MTNFERENAITDAQNVLYTVAHLPEVRDLVETVIACFSRGAEVDHLTDDGDPVRRTFQAMLDAYMREQGISDVALTAALADFGKIGQA